MNQMYDFLVVVSAADVRTNALAIATVNHWGVMVFANNGNNGGKVVRVMENAEDTSAGGTDFKGFCYGTSKRGKPFAIVNLPTPIPIPNQGAYAVNGWNGNTVSHANSSLTNPCRAVFYWQSAREPPTNEWIQEFHANFEPVSHLNNPCGRSMAAFYNAWSAPGNDVPAVPPTEDFSDEAYAAATAHFLQANNCV